MSAERLRGCASSESVVTRSGVGNGVALGNARYVAGAARVAKGLGAYPRRRMHRGVHIKQGFVRCFNS